MERAVIFCGRCDRRLNNPGFLLLEPLAYAGILRMGRAKHHADSLVACFAFSLLTHGVVGLFRNSHCRKRTPGLMVSFALDYYSISNLPSALRFSTAPHF